MELKEKLFFPKVLKEFITWKWAICLKYREDNWCVIEKKHFQPHISLFFFCVCVLVTHHTGCLHSLRHIASIGFTPEDVTVEAMSANVHDEGKRVHVPADTHKRQETNATLHQNLLLILEAKRKTHSRQQHIHFICHWENVKSEWRKTDLVFADGDRSVCHIEGYWGPVFFVGRTYQALYGSI